MLSLTLLIGSLGGSPADSRVSRPLIQTVPRLRAGTACLWCASPRKEPGGQSWASLRGRFVARTYLVTQSVSLHWLTRVSRSSSLCGRTVTNSKVLRLAQNSLLAGSTRRLVQLARFIRPIGFFKDRHSKRSLVENKTT